MAGSDGTLIGQGSGRSLFIGGSGRSGTSLLRDILDQHPDIAAIPFETKLVSYETFREYPALLCKCQPAGRSRLTEWLRQYILGWCFRHKVDWPNASRDGWRGWFMWIDRQDLEGCLPLLGEMERTRDEREAHLLFGRFLDALYGTYARKQGKKHWLEKTPVNSVHADFLHKCFPDMRLINIVRDGRDVACSVVRQPWGMNTHAEALDWWAASVYWGVDVQKKLPEGAYFNMRYEDLVARPEAMLQRVVAFLGLPWHDALLGMELTHSSVGRWRNEMPPDALEYAHQKYGKMLAVMGYPVDGLAAAGRDAAAQVSAGSWQGAGQPARSPAVG